MGTWIDQTYLETMIGSDALVGLTDDAEDPATTDSAVVTQAIASAESYVKSVLYARYPTAVAAGTASSMISELCARLALGTLSLRRLGPGQIYGADADEARRMLSEIASGNMSIYEWAAADDGADIGEMDKIQIMGKDDLVDPTVDHYRYDTAHDDDEFTGTVL